MERLDLLADRALGDPVAAPTSIGQLRALADRRARRARNARAVIGAAVVLPLVIIGGLLATRSRPEVIDAAAPATVEVDTVFGAALAREGAVWPADPLPLSDLLGRVGAEMLGWPAVEWGEPDLKDGEGGITGTQPGRSDRLVNLQLRGTEENGWQITSFYPSIALRLDDGAIAGFAVDLSVDVARVEVFHADPVDGTQTRTVLTDGVAGASEIRLDALVSAERAGTFLIVARDASGEATAVFGRSIGSPAQLTVAIDRLVRAGFPAPLPDELASVIDAEGLASTVDIRSILIPGIREGLDLYVVPSGDSSQVQLYGASTDGNSWGGTGADALTFNSSGIVTSQYDRTEADGHTLVVLPDGIEFSPDLASQAVADGSVVVLPFIDDLDRFEVIDGVMTLRT